MPVALFDVLQLCKWSVSLSMFPTDLNDNEFSISLIKDRKESEPFILQNVGTIIDIFIIVA